ncbi:hypothetical protein BI343_07595 [Chromobacterium amazonense]|uniref:hypothetical protein n=1 Tax=Chromobacterium amazonense TaxID=1382803 RepID=UPI0008DAA2E7|nr:hypothetical protein [Chromobacterium amazonense]OHX18577.1 hypothetical protein BI343_07595 [Chromobacterium amazonense]
MTESPKANEPDWSGLNLPVLTEVVDEQAVPTLAEEAGIDVPEFDFSSELDLLEHELTEESPGAGGAALEIPELTLEDLLAGEELAAEPASPVLDFSSLPSLELTDASTSLDEHTALDFVLEPREPAAPTPGPEAFVEAADLQPDSLPDLPPVAQDDVAPPELAPADQSLASEDLSWDDVAAAAAQLPADESGVAELQETLAAEPVPELAPADQSAASEDLSWGDVAVAAEQLPADESGVAELQEALPAEPVPERQAEAAQASLASPAEPDAPQDDAAQPFVSISLDSLPSGVLGGGIGREPAPETGLEWLNDLPKPEGQPASETPPEAPSLQDVLQEAERVLAEERAQLAAQADLPADENAVVADSHEAPEAEAGLANERDALEAVGEDIEPAQSIPSEGPEMDASVAVALPELEASLIEPSIPEPLAVADAASEASPVDQDGESALGERLDEAMGLPELPSAAEASTDAQAAEAEPPMAAGEAASEALAYDAVALPELPVVTEVAQDEDDLPTPQAAIVEAAPADEAPALSETPASAQPATEALPADAMEGLGEEGVALAEEAAAAASLAPLVEQAPLPELASEAPAAIEPESAALSDVDFVEKQALPELAIDQAVLESEPVIDLAQEDVASTASIQTLYEPVPELAPADAMDSEFAAEPEARIESIDAEATVAMPEPALTASMASELAAFAGPQPETEVTRDLDAAAVSMLYEGVPQPAPLEDEDMPALSGLLERGQEHAGGSGEASVADAAASPVSVVSVAAMASAAAAGRPLPPPLDEQALFESLYEQMLPRMKVELSLWLQDAIEVQAKQMLSGMMHQLKEDYEMLFSDALKESLREALHHAGSAGKDEEQP